MANFDDEDDLDNIDDQDLEPVEEAEASAAASSNRNFIIAISILGAIFLLGLIGLLAALFLTGGVGGPAREEAQRQAEATNVAIASTNAARQAEATQAAIDAIANAQLLTPSVTPTATETPVPPTPTNTQVVAQFSPTPSGTPTLEPGGDQAKTATVAALFTQAAAAKVTGTVTATRQAGGVVTSTALPKAGFADDVGLPGLFGLSLVLIAVIVLVRRMRLSTSS